MEDNVLPTKKRAGRIGGRYCSHCGKAVQESTIIPALNETIDVRIPDAVKTIEAEAFSRVSGKVVIIPDGCKSIQSKAFANCTNLEYVWIPGV